jgi:hypothetical protein
MNYEEVIFCFVIITGIVDLRQCAGGKIHFW